MAIIAVSDLNAYLSESDSTAAKTAAVNAACSAVAFYTGYTFDQTQRYEWVRACGRKIRLKARPVLALYRAYVGTQNVARMRFTAADAQAAQVVITGDTSTKAMWLGVASDADETPNQDIALASYASISQLDTALAALGLSAGVWSIETVVDVPPLSFKPMTSDEALDTYVDIEGPDDALEVDHVDELAGVLTLNGPVQDWVYVEYVAGYASSSIPYELKQIAVEMADTILKSAGNDQSLSSEKIGDYAYTTRAGGDLLTQFYPRLDAYRKLSL